MEQIIMNLISLFLLLLLTYDPLAVNHLRVSDLGKLKAI